MFSNKLCTNPNLDNVSNLSTVEKSLLSNHPTVLFNLDTGQRVPHWVELDARTDNDGPTILYIRTLRGLDHDTAYGIGISGLRDNYDELISPTLAFKALIDGNYTNAPDVEARSDSFQNLFNSI